MMYADFAIKITIFLDVIILDRTILTASASSSPDFILTRPQCRVSIPATAFHAQQNGAPLDS